jgi:hypothetical protein
MAPVLRKGDIVVMENLGAHKVSGVREAVEAHGTASALLSDEVPRTVMG